MMDNVTADASEHRMSSRQWAQMIDEAHKLYRASIGTLNEQPAYAFLEAVVARAKAAEVTS